MIYIFTIATNIYSKYFENFKNSINNFLPEKDKKVIVFSNKLQEYNKVQIQNTTIEVVDMPNIIYTSIYLNKFNFILWYCEKNNIKDEDVIYYFDIDTYFYDNPIANQNLLKEIEDHPNIVLFSNHPTNIRNIYKINSTIVVHGYVHEFNDNGIQSKALNDYSFFNNKFINKDCIASFFAGSIKSIKKLNEVYNKYFKNILSVDRVIPQYIDEDIINYIWLQQLTDKIDEQYIYVSEHNFININKNELDEYKMFCDYLYESPPINISVNVYNYFVCNQKFNIKIKDITKT